MASYAVETPIRAAAPPAALELVDTRPRLFGVPVDLCSLPETLARLDALARTPGTHIHHGLNAHTVLLLRENPDLRAALLRASMCSLDGMSCVWTARRVGLPAAERVAGIDLMSALMSHGAERGWSAYFLGATEPVVSRLVSEVSERHPGLHIAGSQHGYFDPADEVAVVTRIRHAQPTVLFLGMPSPQKELFSQRWRHALGARLVVGVGGSFDVLSGTKRRAPGWMQRTGLEWSYRLWQEPGRMASRYLLGNPRYLGLAAKEWWVTAVTS